MKRILIILFLFPACLIAQDTTSAFSFGFLFSNDICSRISKAEGSTADLKQRFDSLEDVSYGYTAGIILSRSFNRNLSLHSGLNYSDRGYSIDTLSEVDLTNVKFHYRYLEVPLRVVYVFSAQKKIRPFVSLGLNFGYLLQAKTKYNQIGQATEPSFNNSDELIRFNLGVSASVGIEKSINTKYKFGVEILVRQSLLSISNSPLQRMLNSAGVCISFARKF